MTTTINLFSKTTNFVSFTAGQYVFKAGDPGDLMYVVIEGEVEIVVNDKAVDTTGPGGTVGEMAIIEAAPRMAGVRAKTDCKLAPIDQKRFLYLVQEAPDFAIKVMRIMSERLRKARGA
jgi:CRP-like cAMP-binding protein